MNIIERLAKEAEGLVEALKNKRFRGLKDILTDIYHDDAHFIYELLQNAEDAHATKVTFTLDSQGLRFQHNGKRQFTPKDIVSINSIGDSTKKDDINQIGKFGIGFKAVFSYTQTPQVFSGKYAFEIHDLVSPKEIEQIPEITKGRNKLTYFRFPFNHPEKTEKTAFDEIRKTIENLPPNTILFLRNIEEIRWEIEKDGKQIGFIYRSKMQKPNCYEIRKKTDELQKTYWLRLTKKIPQKKNLFIAIAFRLMPEKTKRDSKKVNYKIDGEVQKGDVAIFFPAEKETSNLRLYLHAPFAATVARDSIKNQSENLELRDLLVDLLIESLANIKKSGLLDNNFLAILPNSKDELPEFYEPFRNKIIEAFQTENYTPTLSGSYLPANNLIQANSEIKKIITKETIFNYLVDSEDIDWSINAQKGSRVFDFLASLEIKDWSWLDILYKISSALEHLEDAEKILSNLSDKWLQSFYVLLGRAKEETRRQRYDYHFPKVEDAYIVRLQDGKYNVGENTYFQTEILKKGKNLSIVKPEIYQSSEDKLPNEKVKSFLRLIGVKEFESKDEIKIILDKYYKYDELEFLKMTEEDNIKHLKKFMKFLKEFPEENSLFSDYYIFRIEKTAKRKKYYWTPSRIFIDELYEKTRLSSIQSFIDKYKLWSGYLTAIKNQKDFVPKLRLQVVCYMD